MMMKETAHEALLSKVRVTLGGEAADMVSALIAENQSLRAQIDIIEKTNAVLKLKVDAMARRLFGQSSEKIDPAQMQLVFTEIENEVAAQIQSLVESAATDVPDRKSCFPST